MYHLKVASEQKKTEGTIADFIDSAVKGRQQSEQFKRCHNCGAEMQRAHLKCRACMMTTTEARIQNPEAASSNKTESDDLPLGRRKSSKVAVNSLH